MSLDVPLWFFVLESCLQSCLLILLAAVVPQCASATGMVNFQSDLKQDKTWEHNPKWEAEGVMRSQV